MIVIFVPVVVVVDFGVVVVTTTAIMITLKTIKVI